MSATGRLRRLAIRAATCTLALALAFPARADSHDPSVASSRSHATVVLLHGLNRGASSMASMAEALRERGGYRVVNIDYPSAWHDVAALSAHLDRALRGCCERALADDGVHFVTHSLGGVLLRLWSSHNPQARVRRSVMLSPPNQGSELVDELRDTPLFKLVTGPAGQQLGTDEDSVPSRLGPVRFELGVITGRSTLNPIYSWLIPGEDDGKVSVSRARVHGMRDFLVVDASHTFIMTDARVIAQTLRFLATGEFEHAPVETGQ